MSNFKKWHLWAVIAIILWLVPDPIPLIDELLATWAAVHYGRKGE